MASVKGANFTNLTADPIVKIGAGEFSGKVRVQYDSYEASSLASGSDISVARLPKGAIVYDIVIHHDALGSGVTLAVGDSDSAGRYIAATAAATATALTATPATATPAAAPAAAAPAAAAPAAPPAAAPAPAAAPDAPAPAAAPDAPPAAAPDAPPAAPPDAPPAPAVCATIGDALSATTDNVIRNFFISIIRLCQL